MALYAVSLLFSWRNQGWSENHVRQTGGNWANADDVAMSSLAYFRGKILGDEGTIVGYRYRPIGPKLRGQVVTFGNPPNTDTPINGDAGPGDSPSITFDIGWQSASLGNQTQTFLRGVPDNSVIEGGIYNSGAFAGEGFSGAVFLQNLIGYLGILINQPTIPTWGWYGSVQPHQANVSTVTQNVDGTLAIVFAAPIFQNGTPPGPFTPVVATTQTNVRFSGGQRGQPLSRTHAVIVDSTTTCHTVRPVGLLKPPATFKGTYTEYGFVPYSSWSLRHVGTRRVGRQFFVLAGRGKDR